MHFFARSWNADVQNRAFAIVVSKFFGLARTINPPKLIHRHNERGKQHHTHQHRPPLPPHPPTRTQGHAFSGQLRRRRSNRRLKKRTTTHTFKQDTGERVVEPHRHDVLSRRRGVDVPIVADQRRRLRGDRQCRCRPPAPAPRSARFHFHPPRTRAVFTFCSHVCFRRTLQNQSSSKLSIDNMIYLFSQCRRLTASWNQWRRCAKTKKTRDPHLVQRCRLFGFFEMIVSGLSEPARPRIIDFLKSLTAIFRVKRKTDVDFSREIPCDRVMGYYSIEKKWKKKT